MRLQITKDENEWVNLAWTWLHEHVPTGARIFVPAGGTPTPLYRRLVDSPSDFLQSLKLIQIDDIVTGPKRGFFRKFLQTELAPYTKQFEWIDQADRSADACILGVGVNGHVAFHEPSLPASFDSGCVRLSAETLKYLDLKEPTWGVTYGVANFIKAREILVLAAGPAKQTILRQALTEVGQAAAFRLPISYILQHPNVTLVTDFNL